jgi:hypothetical protein
VTTLAGVVTPARIPFRVARDSALIAGRNLRVLRKNPGRLIYPLVQPLVLLVMFVSVFGNLAITGHAGGGSYREFLIPGIIIENVTLTAPASGLALLRDASSGLADRFRSLPMSRAAVLAGRLFTDAVIFCSRRCCCSRRGSDSASASRGTGGLPFSGASWRSWP